MGLHQRRIAQQIEQGIGCALDLKQFGIGNGANLEHFINFFAVASLALLIRGWNRTDYWSLVGSGVCLGAATLVKHEGRKKRCFDAATTADLEQIIGAEASPEFAAQMAEDFQVLLHKLPDEDLRQLALLKLEGWTNAEIATKLECVTRTVERKLSLIRQIWCQEVPI